MLLLYNSLRNFFRFWSIVGSFDFVNKIETFRQRGQTNSLLLNQQFWLTRIQLILLQVNHFYTFDI